MREHSEDRCVLFRANPSRAGESNEISEQLALSSIICVYGCKIDVNLMIAQQTTSVIDSWHVNLRVYDTRAHEYIHRYLRPA